MYFNKFTHVLLCYTGLKVSKHYCHDILVLFLPLSVIRNKFLVLKNLGKIYANIFFKNLYFMIFILTCRRIKFKKINKKSLW